MKARGVVERVHEREVTTKHGKKSAYSAKIGEDWYSLGFKTWGVEAGYEIELEYEMRGEYRNASKVEVIGHGVDKKFDSPPTTSSNTGQAATQGGADFRQRSIVRQNSVTNSVKLLVDGGFIEGSEKLKSSASTSAALVVKVAAIFEKYSLLED